MPQMSPMNWWFLLILFSLLVKTCISFIYFIYLPTQFSIPSINFKTYKSSTLPWVW
uniref:ATP synthase F0 subunit 8 n=1 Tax=Pachycephus smyrnensis TaxID=1090887 RepID=A0A1W6Q5F8_9HYME|nr:ATP synthase F0 subunit 8 [Pachycephus smyrnensis]ARO34948.1 ATP synthase F0 subunit 8 [Pachycephus smyrnensis]UTY22575.1 ATP synthase F0 subunit 8 [Pachycephus smyrnensis]